MRLASAWVSGCKKIWPQTVNNDRSLMTVLRGRPNDQKPLTQRSAPRGSAGRKDGTEDAPLAGNGVVA